LCGIPAAICEAKLAYRYRFRPAFHDIDWGQADIALNDVAGHVRFQEATTLI